MYVYNRIHRSESILLLNLSHMHIVVPGTVLVQNAELFPGAATSFMVALTVYTSPDGLWTYMVVAAVVVLTLLVTTWQRKSLNHHSAPSAAMPSTEEQQKSSSTFHLSEPLLPGIDLIKSVQSDSPERSPPRERESTPSDHLGTSPKPAATSDNGVPPAEWTRFLAANNGDVAAATRQHRAHLRWRAENLPWPPSSTRPAWMHFHGRARDGTLVMHCIGAMCDLSLGTREEYVMDLAAAIDAALDRAGDEQVTVLLDTRGGQGWKNPPAPKMVGLGRLAGSTLSANFPERLSRVIVYPVPWPLGGLWTLIKPFLHARTAAKVVLLQGAGRATKETPDQSLRCPPTLGTYVTLEAIREDFQVRHADLPIQ